MPVSWQYAGGLLLHASHPDVAVENGSILIVQFDAETMARATMYCSTEPCIMCTWAAYWSVETADRQFCLPHLLRDVVGVDQREDSPCWKAFSKRLRRLVKDGIRLSTRRREYSTEVYEQRCHRLDKRLVELAEGEYESADARRLAKRMFKHQNHIFTFLDHEDVTFDNNFGERMIRPAVIIRKNSQSNRSERGAATQAILMSIFRTLRLRGLDPIKTIVDVMRTYVATGQLPPLPTKIAANG